MTFYGYFVGRETPPKYNLQHRRNLRLELFEQFAQFKNQGFKYVKKRF